ncbi:MAG: GNAT family N-acetyltransferase [Prevotellaceae bacterium]|jgi:ribosomal protein S18 acetylase RimI-like enzyme|nr:GNAT family N-acetyltransferase [Prevotellaceae bacterium]
MIVEVQKALYEDLPDILNLQKLAFRSEAELYGCLSIEQMTQTTDSILSDFQNYTFWKAVFESKIVGSVKAYSENGICSVARLIVNPEFQNKGIAKQLMAAVEDEFPTAKIFKLFTGHKSFKNIALYQSIGYRITTLSPSDDIPDLVIVEMEKIAN